MKYYLVTIENDKAVLIEITGMETLEYSCLMIVNQELQMTIFIKLGLLL